MQLGLALPHYDFSFPDGRPASVDDVVSYARRAEALGFGSVWVSDHLFLDLAKYGGPAEPYRTPECLATLASIAAATDRIRVGSLVLNAAFRNPAVLSLEARTIHDASGGRLELGLGAGWYEPEFDAAGIAFGSVGERMDRLEETVTAVRTEADVVPLWIGGKGGPRVMRIVAAVADGWNVVWRMDPATYRARLDVLFERCERAQRDPATVRRSVGLYTLLGRDDADVARRFEAWRGWARGVLDGVDLAAFADGALVGTPEACAERIRAFEALGVETVICCFAPMPFGVAEDEQLELAAAELLPLVP